MADELKRYDAELHHGALPVHARMVEAPDGDWVDADEALAAIASLRRDLRGFQAQDDRLGALLAGTPEATHPAPLVARVVSYCASLAAERDEARAEVAAGDAAFDALLDACGGAETVADAVRWATELVDQLRLSADTIESLLPQRYPGLAEVFRAETQRDAIRAGVAKYGNDAPGPTGERE